jgi:predicted anti-sigma-YlaC factor YlaD
MIPTKHPVVCERVRAQVSLEVDGELSQLERAMLAAHVLRCAECRAHRRDVHALTRALRAAPFETAPPVAVRRYRRSIAAMRLQAGAVAAMVFAVVGIASQVVGGQQQGPGLASLHVVHFQTQNELEREQALIEGNAALNARGPGEATVR